MSGNKIGGLKAAKTNKERHGKDFFRTIGKSGGKSPKTRPAGFATMDRERLLEVSARGGVKSAPGYTQEQYDAYLKRVKRYAKTHTDETITKER